jgi:hypothetical protein
MKIILVTENIKYKDIIDQIVLDIHEKHENNDRVNNRIFDKHELSGIATLVKGYSQNIEINATYSFIMKINDDETGILYMEHMSNNTDIYVHHYEVKFKIERGMYIYKNYICLYNFYQNNYIISKIRFIFDTDPIRQCIASSKDIEYISNNIYISTDDIHTCDYLIKNNISFTKKGYFTHIIRLNNFLGKNMPIIVKEQINNIDKYIKYANQSKEDFNQHYKLLLIINDSGNICGYFILYKNQFYKEINGECHGSRSIYCVIYMKINDNTEKFLNYSICKLCKEIYGNNGGFDIMAIIMPKKYESIHDRIVKQSEKLYLDACNNDFKDNPEDCYYAILEIKEIDIKKKELIKEKCIYYDNDKYNIISRKKPVCIIMI